MITTNRRRQFGAETIPELEYPDAFMLVFSGNAGTAYNVMYQGTINHYILDGIEAYPTSAVKAVTPTTSGKHVLYFWINSGNRLANGITLSYLRIPANPTYFHGAFLYNCWGLQQIDFLGETPPAIGSDFGNCYGNPKITVRVPIGTTEAYRDKFNNTTLKSYIKEIVETKDFTYNI